MASNTTPTTPKGDDLAGFAWFNGLTDSDRLFWLQQAGSAAPIDAWGAFKAVAAGRQIQAPPPPMAGPGRADEPPRYGRGRGRPPKAAAERVISVSMRMTEAQRAKLDRLGGAEAVRAWIDSVQEDGPKA